MTTVPINLPISVPPTDEDFTTALNRATESLGLTITLESTLTSYAGSIHWHLKQGTEAGTVEVTWWNRPDGQRAWVSRHANRTGSGWTIEMAGKLAEEIIRQLAGHLTWQPQLHTYRSPARANVGTPRNEARSRPRHHALASPCPRP